jgi:hypothetical protein
MKYIVGISLLLISTSTLAQHHHRHHHHHHHQRNQNLEWIVPVIVGGVIGYGISQSRQPAQPAPPARAPEREVIIVREPVCTAWQEYHYPDGTVVRERTCR